jgi:hypothetical protein
MNARKAAHQEHVSRSCLHPNEWHIKTAKMQESQKESD